MGSFQPGRLHLGRGGGVAKARRDPTEAPPPPFQAVETVGKGDSGFGDLACRFQGVARLMGLSYQRLEGPREGRRMVKTPVDASIVPPKNTTVVCIARFGSRRSGQKGVSGLWADR